MFSQALFTSSLSFKFYKAADLFEMLIWYCFLTFSSFSFLTFDLSPSNFCAPCLRTAYLSLTFAATIQRSVSHSDHLKYIYSNAVTCLSVCDQSGEVFIVETKNSDTSANDW